MPFHEMPSGYTAPDPDIDWDFGDLSESLEGTMFDLPSDYGGIPPTTGEFDIYEEEEDLNVEEEDLNVEEEDLNVYEQFASGPQSALDIAADDLNIDIHSDEFQEVTNYLYEYDVEPEAFARLSAGADIESMYGKGSTELESMLDTDSSGMFAGFGGPAGLERKQIYTGIGEGSSTRLLDFMKEASGMRGDFREGMIEYIGALEESRQDEHGTGFPKIGEQTFGSGEWTSQELINMGYPYDDDCGNPVTNPDEGGRVYDDFCNETGQTYDPGPVEESCFSPDGKVELEDGTVKEVRDIKKGDMVKAIDNGKVIYSKVLEDLYINMKDEGKEHYYVKIRTKDSTLKVTMMHRVFVKNLKKNINAHKIKPGMKVNVVKGNDIVSSEVLNIEHLYLKGRYDLYTDAGTVIVDGVVCSTLAFLPQWFTVPVWKFFNKHPKLYKFAYKYIYYPWFKLAGKMVLKKNTNINMKVVLN